MPLNALALVASALGLLAMLLHHFLKHRKRSDEPDSEMLSAAGPRPSAEHPLTLRWAEWGRFSLRWRKAP